MSDSGDDHYVVRCRGLPWSATAQEIVDFFDKCQVKDGCDGVHLTMTREGRPSGEAYVELESQEDVDEAVKCDRKNMGKRYVEVFAAKYSEMEWVVKRNANGGNSDGFGSNQHGGDGGDHVVRLRGLPFECSKDDIIKFFDGLDVSHGGILLTTDYQGRSSGEAFVQFGNADEAERALEKNRESIGHRYIEIFRSNMSEAGRNSGMDNGYGGPRGGGGGGGGSFTGFGRFGSGGGGGGGMRGPRDMGGYGGGGGGGNRRPGPYDRMGPNPMGRGYGAMGPSGGSGGGGGGMRGPRGGNFKGGYDSYDNFGGGGGGGGGGYGGGNFGGGGGGGGGFGGGYGGSGGGGGGGGGGGRHIVRMRGLPFRVTENDIAEWFSSVADPIDIVISFNNQGKPTGEADVAFSCESDAKRAMTKDRQNMQHRYVELFYNAPGGGGGSGGRGGNGGGMAFGGAGGGGGSGMPSAYAGFHGQY